MKDSDHQIFPYVSVDCAIFGFDQAQLHVLLIDRAKAGSPEKLHSAEYALPGDLIYTNENLDMAALRILKELTGLEDIFLEQFGTFGAPDRLANERDKEWLKSIRQFPDVRVVTVGYYSLVNMNEYQPKAASFASSAQWVPMHTVGNLPFDHNKLLRKAKHKLKEKLKAMPIGFNLLPQKFTLAELQKLYEVILDKELDKRNFRRKILKIGMLQKLDEKQVGVAHKPASFYSFDEQTYQELVQKGFDNFGF